jgi:hypothetical protein
LGHFLQNAASSCLPRLKPGTVLLRNALEFLAGYDLSVAFQIDQNIISLADIRKTTNSVNPLYAVSDSSLAATAELSATPPSHPPGEWPNRPMSATILQKLSLFRVAAFFIADVGNGLILGCSSEFESSVCSQVPF